MSNSPSTIPTDDAHRHGWQRELGSRYDGLHALLVRIVHPLTFAAFLLMSVIVGGIIGGIALEVADSDTIGYVLVGIAGIVFAVVGAFTFVATVPRAVFGIVLLVGWGTALFLIDDIDPAVLWAAWSIAGASVVLQVVLLMWVVPRRVRNGLLHVEFPAVIGTMIGAIPVIAGIWALAVGRDQLSVDIALVAMAATAVVLMMLAVLQLLIRRNEVDVLAQFAAKRDLKLVADTDTKGNAEPLIALLPNWAWRAGLWAGKVADRRVALVSGFTGSRSPDIPSIHVTMIALESQVTGRDLWVRDRDLSDDNMIVSGGHTKVTSFESIELDERCTVRIDAHVSELDAWRMVGPQLLDLLNGLGAAQLCRTGGALCAWIAGGALDAGELDRLLDLMLAIVAQLDKADAALARDAVDVPVAVAL